MEVGEKVHMSEAAAAAIIESPEEKRKLTLAAMADDDDQPNVDILSEIEVPERFYTRMCMGIQVIDELFGGAELPGILPGTSYLFTGDPGAGKSTVALQFADLLATKEKKVVLYNAGEESKWMIKLRANRLGIAGRFAISYFEDVEQLVQYIEDYGVEVVFIDSIQQLTFGNYTGRQLLEKIVKLLHRYGHANNVTMFLVGQVTKSGVFSGPNAIKHDTDAHAHLSVSKETGHRVFEMQKNRMGPANIPYEFFLGAQGLDFKQLPPGEEEKKEAMGKAAGRREGIKDFIIDQLKAGEKISGYCFERFSQECSGGFWRGMIIKATKELQDKGFKIGETRKGPGGDGRTHVFIIQDVPKPIVANLKEWMELPPDDPTPPPGFETEGDDEE